MNDSRPPPSISESERSRANAADRYVALGAVGVPKLLEMLTESSWVVRRSVVAGLAALGEAAIPGLVHVLRTAREDETRVAATVDALSLSAGFVEDAIIELTRDPDVAVVCDAAQILGRRRSLVAVPALERLLGGEDDNAAVAAIEALGRIGGSAALTSLTAASRSAAFFRVFPAIDVLGRTGDPRAVAPLTDLLANPLYAQEAARALGRTGESGAVLPLANLLLRPGEANLRIAAVALAELCKRAEERHGTASAVIQAMAPLSRGTTVIRRLAQGLRDSDAAERAAICVVLGGLETDESIATLTNLVEHPPPVGPAASRALARLGQNAQAQFSRVLQQGGSAQRIAVLPLVSGPGARESVIRCLGDEDPAVRVLACGALGRLANPDAVGPLFDRLEDPDPAVVHAAVAAIQSLGGPETERRALELARSSKEGERRSAIRILAYFGYVSAFDVLFVSMTDPDPRVRDAAINGLAFVEDERATTALLRTAEGTAARPRALAMKALGHRTVEPLVTDQLRQGLSDRDAWVRYYACQSLGRLRVSEASGDIQRLIRDEAGQVRVAAVEALARIGGDVGLAALLEAASRDDDDVRRAALIGLGIAGHPQALQALLTSAEATDAMTRLFALSALSVLGAPEVLTALIAGSRDPNEVVRTASRSFLAERPGTSVAEALVRALEGEKEPEWIVSALSSAAGGRPSAILAALPTADERLARHLVSALGRMGGPEGTAALVSAMSLDSAIVRKVAASTLGAVGNAEALSVLGRVAREDSDPEVRRVATLLLPV